MNEEQGFLAALAAGPEDDTTRLVYADWLDEQNDPRGRYLRAELELGNLTEGEIRYAELEAELRELREGIDPAWLEQAGRRYDVVLRAYLPVRKITLIHVLRSLTDRGLKECKDLTDTVPTVVLSKRPRQEAEHARDSLCYAHGSSFTAEVEVVRSDKVLEALSRRPVGVEGTFDVYLCSVAAGRDRDGITALRELTGMDRRDCMSLLARPLPALVLAGVSPERAQQASWHLWSVAAARAEVRWATGGPPALPSLIAPAPLPADGLFQLVLCSYPAERKIIVIRAIREVTALGLREAKDLSEVTLPVVICDSLDAASAFRARQAFEGVAEVELQPV